MVVGEVQEGVAEEAVRKHSALTRRQACVSSKSRTDMRDKSMGPFVG